ncbi:MAG: translation elongation factor Ts [Patescibacteria group bacterium]
MSNISATDIKKLREATGARVMDCKKALEEAGGDFAKATKLVEERGLARAEKNADRETKVGYVGCYVHTNGMIGAMVEVLCETDFVAKNEEFRQMVNDIAMHLAAMGAENNEDLLGQEFIRDASKTIEGLIKSLSGKIGEKMVLNRFQRFSVGE